MLWILSGAFLIGLLLAASARRISLLSAGVVLLLFSVAIFGVRLGQAGPYPFPRGMDLAAGVAALLLGGLSVWQGARTGMRTGVSRAGRILLLLFPVAFLFGFAAVLHEVEEVAILRTEGQAGSAETRLWVVDHGAAVWVLTGTETRFGRNVATSPRLELVRLGETSCRVAAVHQDLETIREVSLARRQKYLAERLAWAVGYPRAFYTAEQLQALQPGGPTEGISLGSAAAYRLDPCPGEV